MLSQYTRQSAAVRWIQALCRSSEGKMGATAMHLYSLGASEGKMGVTAMHLYSLSASEGKMGVTAMHLYSLGASEIQQFFTNGLMWAKRWSETKICAVFVHAQLPIWWVTDDVTWPRKVKVVIPICLMPNISKTDGDRDLGPVDHQ